MTDCLASTGSTTLLPYMIIAGILLVAGVVAFVFAKRKSGWAALAIVPLLIGVGIFGSAAPSAKAGTGVECVAPTSSATPTPTPTVTPAPTPTPPVDPIVPPTVPPTAPPTCAPTDALPSIAPATDEWMFTASDGFNGYLADWASSNATAVQALLDAGAPNTATVTITGNYESAPDTFSQTTFSFSSPVVQSGTDDVVRIGTDGSAFVYVPQAEIDAAFLANEPLGQLLSVTSVSVVVPVVQPDGCDASVTSTITFTADVQPPA